MLFLKRPSEGVGERLREKERVLRKGKVPDPLSSRMEVICEAIKLPDLAVL